MRCFHQWKKAAAGYFCITAEGINLPGALLPAYPGWDNNPDQFAGALYEASGLRELSRLTYTQLKLYGTTTNPGGAARMISAVREEAAAIDKSTSYNR